ncbi:DNA primase [Agilicoccus flavus]|uniref:DNA primase n=1 Tax=Agilicoccus flavus TaxID=2775968 RepID=UPI001CF6F13B|nr:DNA primase [Agilicoccus flavus]
MQASRGGRIRDDDVALVKERALIDEVVRQHVTLTRAGVGRLKGLCPFHDEKTASFNVRPAQGHWHCFGCDEGGDVISFVMKIDHVTFVEAVEQLADRFGISLTYEEGRGRDDAAHGRRARLIEAHRAAEDYYRSALLADPQGRAGRDFLRERGFDRAAAERFGVGFAPRSGEALAAELRGKGFTDEELVLAGLVGRGGRGLYDRFRGRLVWPIRDLTGATVGFGARRLFDDDRIEAKYLNTSETPIYKKTSVLYGLDLAKKAISTTRRAVVVEGYTDVMACHLAGVESAVATCGTSFGTDHVATLRRLLRDDAQSAPARTIFTFDGDAAGQKAAMRAFSLDQRWASQSYVAVADSGQDPCDLRIRSGDGAVRLLVEQAVPMFEFAVRTTLAAYDLDHAEGRVQAMRAVAPIIADIRDRSLRPEYTRTVSGWIGVEVEQVAREVARAADAERRPGHAAPVAPAAPPVAEPGAPQAAPVDPETVPFGFPNLRDPEVDLEHQLLQVLVQHPRAVADADAAALAAMTLSDPGHHAVMHAVLTQWGRHETVSSAAWVDALDAAAGPRASRLVSHLAVAPVKARVDPTTMQPDERYVDSLVVRMRENALKRRIADATGALRRAEGDDPARAHGIAVELTALQRDLAGLRARVS